MPSTSTHGYLAKHELWKVTIYLACQNLKAKVPTLTGGPLREAVAPSEGLL